MRCVYTVLWGCSFVFVSENVLKKLQGSDWFSLHPFFVFVSFEFIIQWTGMDGQIGNVDPS